jgi:hypothetical protein
MTPKGFLSAGWLIESELVAKDEVVRIYGLHNAAWCTLRVWATWRNRIRSRPFRPA